MHQKQQYRKLATNERLVKPSEQIGAPEYKRGPACRRIARIAANTVRSFNKAMQKRIKVKDVANYCMVSKTTVRRWIENGKLRAIRLPSGHYRINRVDYRRFLESCETPSKEVTFESKSKRKEET